MEHHLLGVPRLTAHSDNRPVGVACLLPAPSPGDENGTRDGIRRLTEVYKITSLISPSSTRLDTRSEGLAQRVSHKPMLVVAC